MGINIAELTIVVIIVFLSFYLGLRVYYQDKKFSRNKFFANFAISLGLWIGVAYLSELTARSNFNLTVFLSRAAIAAGIWFMVNLLFFSLTYRKNFKFGVMTKFFAISNAALMPVIVSTPMFVKSIRIKEYSFEFINGPLYIYLVLLYGLCLIAFTFVNFFVAYKKLSDLERVQIRYFFSGLLIFILISFFSSVVLTLITGTDVYYRIGNYSSIFLIGFTAFAIFKQKFMDLRPILTEVGIIVILISMLVNIITFNNITELLISISLFLLVAYGGAIMIKSVYREIMRRKEIELLAKEREMVLQELDERNQNLSTLQKFSNIVLDNEELKPMIQKIINKIPDEVQGCVGAVVALVDPEDDKMKGFCLSEAQLSEELDAQWKAYLKKYCLPLNNKENLLMNCYHYQEIQKGNHLSDFMCPPFEKGMASKLQKASGIKGMIAIPLAAKDEKFGVLVFGMKKDVEDLDTGEVSMVTAIADEVSLAAQRAISYENLKKANQYLKELDQMKDEFISVASHEMNTPLAAIQGYLSMILDEGMGKVDATAKEYLDRVYASSKRLAALILDLLNVSRIEQGRIHLMYAEIGPEELVKSVMDELVVKSDAKGLTLKYIKPEDELPTTWVDVNRIREVLVNLVGNSIKFTEKGGIQIRADKEGRMLKFTVTDTGVGVPEDGADKLFKKFSQLNREKNEFQGSGLGLYISKSIVKLHGGDMWVVPTPKDKTGATFCFTIPIIKDKPADPFEGQGAVLTAPTKSEASEVEKQVTETVGVRKH